MRAYGLSLDDYQSGVCGDVNSKDFDSPICNEMREQYNTAIKASDELCNDNHE